MGTSVIEPEAIRHFGWISVALAVIAGVITMRLWPMEARRSFSENVARKQSSSLLFSLWMTPVTILFYAFLLGWIGPERGMNIAYYVIASVMAVFQLVLSWVPASTGWKLLLHNIASYGLVLLMPVLLLVLVLFSSPALSILQLVLLLSFVLYTVVLLFLFFFRLDLRAKFLQFQVSLMIFVWLAILAAGLKI